MVALQRLVMGLVLVFMVGSLLGLGLELAVKDAVHALRNVRFVLLIVVWGWVLGPALAWLLATVIPMEAPYATGLLLLGMAPCAPFVPMLVERGGGDLAYTGALMLLTAIGTVLFMPLAVPVMVRDLTADAWMIGRPLLYYVLLPLAAGVLIRACAPVFAGRLRPVVKRITGLATALLLVGMAIVYGRDMLGAIGSYAIGAQTLFFGALMVASYSFGSGLTQGQRSVLSLGMGTRNIGAALAPLVAVEGTDPRAIVMCAIAIVVTVVLAAVAAKWFGGHAWRAAPAMAGPKAN
jgi:BASS family bile acid:Na+ symporter